jgi:hypothetical protein
MFAILSVIPTISILSKRNRVDSSNSSISVLSEVLRDNTSIAFGHLDCFMNSFDFINPTMALMDVVVGVSPVIRLVGLLFFISPSVNLMDISFIIFAFNSFVGASIR